MTEQTQEGQSQAAGASPRVIADFGGRRKVLDRRLKQSTNDRQDRRSGKDRRSGFDRRGTLKQLDENEQNHRNYPTKE